MVKQKINPLRPLVTIHTAPLVIKSTHSTNRPYLCVSLGYKVGRDSSVGIATRYWMDGPGIESLWGIDFPYPFRSALGPTQPPIKWSFPGVKQPWPSVDHPSTSRAEVKERVELCLCSPCWPSWPVLEWSLAFMWVINKVIFLPWRIHRLMLVMEKKPV